MDEPTLEARDDGREPVNDANGESQMARAALSRAATAWQRRGYQVRYRDDYLVQLIRRSRPTAVCLVLGLVGIAGTIAGWMACQSWQVVSLAAAPDGRVITHQQRTRHAPTP